MEHQCQFLNFIEIFFSKSRKLYTYEKLDTEYGSFDKEILAKKPRNKFEVSKHSSTDSGDGTLESNAQPNIFSVCVLKMFTVYFT